MAKDQSIDEVRIKHLQKLIDQGRYEVDAAAVAEHLLDSYLSLPE